MSEAELDYWRIQAADVLTQLHEAEAEASALRQLATALVVELRIARTDAYGTDHAETADIFDLAASVLDNRRAGQPLLEEVARLRSRMADLSRQVGEQNTTIGYQDAMIALLRGAAIELLSQLALLLRQDEKFLWQIGGRGLDDAYKALGRAVEATKASEG